MQRVRRKRIMMLSLVGLTAFLALLAVVRGTYHITIDELLGADTLGRIMFGSGALPVGIMLESALTPWEGSCLVPEHCRWASSPRSWARPCSSTC
jgi:Na+/phosphate symporter